MQSLLHALEICEVIKLLGERLAIRTFDIGFKLARCVVVHPNLVRYFSPRVVEPLLLVLDSFVPCHGEEPFDVGLCHSGFLLKTRVGSLLLSSENIRLAFHESVSLSFVLSPLQEAPEDRLDLQNAMVSDFAFVDCVASLLDISPRKRLDLD